MIVIYSETEKRLLEYEPYLAEVPSYELVRLGEVLDSGEEIWMAIELGRCPSTDNRTYILHTSRHKPEFDYYGMEKISLDILKKTK